jgi:protein-S-isoprenylcysteine O-methyltransferase Ste14
MEILFFLIGFCAAFAGYLLHTILHYLRHCGYRDKFSFRMEALFTIIIFCGYAGWGLMLATDPVPLKLPGTIVILGGIMGIAGSILFFLAIHGLHGFKGEKGLVTTGVYANMRHPMYIGIIFMHLGFPLLFGSAITLLSTLIWVPQILFWGKWEDEELEERFGDVYKDYRKKTLF